MKEWFSLSEQDRKDLITAAAGRLNLVNGIIEKDIWLITVFSTIFNSEKYANHFIFKGGTSLSKIFGIIHRFSEDIDLILNWDLLGYAEKGMDPWADRSRTKQDKFNKEMHARGNEYLTATFAPWLQDQLSYYASCNVPVVPMGDGIIAIRYPAYFPAAYVRDSVLLEIGPLASWIPSTKHKIRSYVSELFPHIFKEFSAIVTVTTAERTFWEKATIAHQIAYSDKLPPVRYSRHYYDLFMLHESSISESALSKPELLHSVTEFKDRFYPSRKARYDLAVPGTLRLLPDSHKLKILEKDYKNMEIMFFRSPPPWSKIIKGLQELENRINNQKPLH